MMTHQHSVVSYFTVNCLATKSFNMLTNFTASATIIKGEKGEKGDRGDSIMGQRGLQGPPGPRGMSQE